MQANLAIALKKSGIYTPLFLLNFISHDLSRERKIAAKLGIQSIQLLCPALTQLEETSLARRTLSPQKKNFRTYLRSIISKQALISKARNILLANNIKLLVISNNKLAFYSPYIVKAAKTIDVPVAVLPFGLESANSFKQKLVRVNSRYLRKSILHNVASFLLPQWCTDSANPILCASLGEIISLYILSSIPNLPNSPYGGCADYIFVESDFMERMYATLVHSSTIQLKTGSPQDDDLHSSLLNKDQIKQAIARSFNFDPKKPIIVASIPQDIPGAWPEQTSYSKLLMEFSKALSEHSGTHNLIVCPHPKANPTFIKRFFSAWPAITTANPPISHILPIGDFYVCSESSTIRMAITCRLPVINFDCYNFNYQFFGIKDGVVTINTGDELRKSLNSFCTHDKLFQECLTNQKEAGHYFGKLDGNSNARISTAIAGILIEKRLVL